jgi:hypothetical protein
MMFDFCLNSRVVTNLAPENDGIVVSSNGWTHTSRPTTPYQLRFKVMLYGLRWYLEGNTDFYDPFADPEHNARRLELFYREHQRWKPFKFSHPHLGYQPIDCRFVAPISVPAAVENSGGVIEPLEVQLLHHNPGFQL